MPSLPKETKYGLPKKGSISGRASGGLGDIWADLRPGPDPGFLDGIRALVGSGAHRAAAPVKILLQQSGG